MGRVITTFTDLSNYNEGDSIRIAGSDCCWVIIGETPPDLTARKIKVVESNCYYYSITESLGTEDVQVITF